MRRWPAITIIAAFAAAGSTTDAVGQRNGKTLVSREPTDTALFIAPVRRRIICPVLTFHTVGSIVQEPNDNIEDSLTVAPVDFEQEVAWLRASGFQTVTFAQLMRYSQGRFVLPNHPVVLTFDDGQAATLKNAVPILLANGFAGTFAIITQFPGMDPGRCMTRYFPGNTTPRLEFAPVGWEGILRFALCRHEYATWTDIRSAYLSGMEIVSHGREHLDALNKKYSDAALRDELEGSRTDLHDHLEIDTRVLIYPYGRYSDRYIRIAKQAGFVMGISTKRGARVDFDDLMHVPRIRVDGVIGQEKFVKTMRWIKHLQAVEIGAVSALGSPRR